MTRSSYRRVFVDGPLNVHRRATGTLLGVDPKPANVTQKRGKRLNVLRLVATPFVFIVSIFAKKR